MKHFFALTIGFVVGVVLLLALLYVNPLTMQSMLSPLSVTDKEVMLLTYSGVGSDALVYTNDGASRTDPHPEKVIQLRQPPVKRTTAMATVLSGARNEPVGIGIKFSSDSESTDVLMGDAIVDSVWHIYLPERGSLFVAQRENHWNYIRDVIIPAYWNSGNGWRGHWSGHVTVGPGTAGMARVVGGSGEFDGLATEAIETLITKAYSVNAGPLSERGELAIEVPGSEDEITPDP